MSYDILFVRAGDSPDRLAAARNLAEREFEFETETKPSAEADQRRRVLVADLLTLHSSLRFEASEDGESMGGWVGSDDEGCPYPQVELGVDSAMVAISYSANEDVVFGSVRPIVQIFTRHGYVAYDPQRGSLLEYPEAVPQSQAQFTRTHDVVVGELQARSETLVVPARDAKPWWKFW